MLIFSNHACGWENILTEKFGIPKDNSENKNGKKWTVKKYVTENNAGSPKSTLLIQSEKSTHSANIHFLKYEIPKLFNEVLKDQTQTISYEKLENQ